MPEITPFKVEVGDLLGLGKMSSSPALERLVDAVMAGIGRLYEDVVGPGSIKRRSKAEVDAAVYAIQNLVGADPISLDVSGRAALRLSGTQTRQQLNRENVAIEAVKIAQDEFAQQGVDKFPPGQIDDQWLHQFWSAAENVSDEQMQSMWARILARKSALPKELGVRVLQRMNALTADEIDQIVMLSPFATKLFSTNSEFPDNYGIFDHLGQHDGTLKIREELADLSKYLAPHRGRLNIRDLDSAGIMQSSTGWASEFFVPYSKNIFIQIGNEKFAILNLPAPNERYEINYSIASGTGLTREGWEIASIANMRPDEGYVEMIGLALESAGASLVKQT